MEYKGYASLSTIADKLLRHPLMRGISYEAIIDYAIDFMRIVQCGGFFEDRCTIVKIENNIILKSRYENYLKFVEKGAL